MPAVGSFSSSSSFDLNSASTPPPAHAIARSSTNSATNLSTNGRSSDNTKPEPVDYSDMPQAFVTEAVHEKLQEDVAPVQPSFRPSKRKSAAPSKRVCNSGSPLPAMPVAEPAPDCADSGVNEDCDDNSSSDKFPKVDPW